MTSSQTAKSFGDKWNEPRSRMIGVTESDRKTLTIQFLATLGCDSMGDAKQLFSRAKKTLNAGCGVAWSEYLYEWDNPLLERHCIDMSKSVEVARDNTDHLADVIVIQGDILNLPYKDETFDIVYSNGVVHHTPDARRAVLELGKKVVEGGLLGIYIYCIKPFIREVCDKEIRKHTTKMSYEEAMKFSHSISLLGKSLNDLNQKIYIEENIELLGIKAGEYNLQQFIYDHFVKCWYNSDQGMQYSDLVNVDWYHPYYASHHTKEEVLAWFKEAGFHQLKCKQPTGFEHSGYFISGRKNV